jgi:hypothetical protein
LLKPISIAAAILEKKERFLNRQIAKHAARAAKENAQKQCNAHDVRNVLLGAGAQRLLRFGGLNTSQERLRTRSMKIHANF